MVGLDCRLRARKRRSTRGRQTLAVRRLLDSLAEISSTVLVVIAKQCESGERRMPRIAVDAGTVLGAHGSLLEPGAGRTEFFKDFEHGPEMVVVPAGEFMMGSTEKDIDEKNQVHLASFYRCEGPQHRVKFPSPFAVGRYATTFLEWDAYLADIEGHTDVADDFGWGRKSRPVIDVSWADATAYTAWLSDKTGKNYRLLTEAEWEYVARAGTDTWYWWGSHITPDCAHYDYSHGFGDPDQGQHPQELWPSEVGQRPDRTIEVDQRPPNPWGIHQLNGNVYEWCADDWHESYDGAPNDGTAWILGEVQNAKIMRGGCWGDIPHKLMTSYRERGDVGERGNYLGFRVARTL
jgi:formylglycine-generating enzyme required for sulfatase activity